MSIRKETERTEISRFTGLERDSDIHTLANVSSIVDNLPGSSFIVTGSYAVEALTQTPLIHDDMDSNVFTENVRQNLPQIATTLEQQPGFNLYKRTDDRLEYDVGSETGLVIPRRLEIQFVEIDGQAENDSLEFILKGQNNNLVVPTARVPIVDSYGNESILRVKSLPYLIATWAIRISGVAQNAKRDVRPSDLDQLRLLLTGEYTEEDVFEAMNNHPQMPEELLASNIHELALAKL